MAYFGPAATFTQEALLTQPDLALADLTSLGSIQGVLDAVAGEEFDLGFVPIENGIEGTVSATIDGLIHRDATSLRVAETVAAPSGAAKMPSRRESMVEFAGVESGFFDSGRQPASSRLAAASNAGRSRVFMGDGVLCAQ